MMDEFEKHTMRNFEKLISVGEKYFPAMHVTEQMEADAYFELCIRHSMSLGLRRAEAAELERKNIFHVAMASHQDNATIARIKTLFKIDMDPEQWLP